MKKLIAITLCVAFAALVFSGCRGSVRDENKNNYTEPTNGITVPSMPSEPTIPSETVLPSQPTTENLTPSEGVSEPTRDSGMTDTQGMDANQSRSGR